MYKAMISKIDQVRPIEGADRIHVATVLGEQVIVSKEWNVGHVGVFFPPDTQLSEEYCKENNLFRDSSKNSDTNRKGFFDDNRRVRAQPFLGQRSEGFFAELDSLAFTGTDIRKLKIGESFDVINGHNIATKYISEKTRKAMRNASGKKKERVIETPMFKQHVDTAQFKYEAGNIPPGSLITLQAKVHGTSARYSYSLVRENVTGWRKVVNNIFGEVFKPVESWQYLVGTRRVTLFEKDTDKEGFHGSEQYRFDVLEMLKPYLEKGMTIYGEIAGYANGKPIMAVHKTNSLKNKEFTKKYGKEVTYNYGCKEHEFRFHVYRITYTSVDGKEVDFTDMQIQSWCEARNILAPYNVCEPFIYDGSKEDLVAIVENMTERPYCLTEDYIDPSHVSEGIIVRVDSGNERPKFYKSKSYAFRVMEGIAKENEVDIEDAS